MSKTVLEAAIAARDAALDRGALAARERVRPLSDTAKPRPVDTTTVARTAPRAERGDSAAPPFVINLAQPTVARTPSAVPRPVPDVHGLPLRQAVYALHQAGFRVQLQRSANAGTWPAAGASMPPGSIVKLFAAQ